MKTRTPVDLHGVRIESSAPGTQAVDRDAVRFGVSLGGQSAPVQHLDMHRPEGLDGLVVPVLGYRLARPLAQLTCPDPGQFQHFQRPQPATERASVQSIVTAICGTAHATSTPCLGVKRPERTTCLVLEVSLSHPRSSIMRRNPISFASAPPNRCARPGRLQPTERRQDKSREARGGRSAGKRAMIKDLAQCVPAHESLPIRTSHCKYKQQRTSRSERDATRR